MRYADVSKPNSMLSRDHLMRDKWPQSEPGNDVTQSQTPRAMRFGAHAAAQAKRL